MSRLLSLRPAIRRLEVAELFHLRAHCIELAERLQDAERQVVGLKRDVNYWQDCAERWREAFIEDVNEHGLTVGLTVDGHIFPNAGEPA